MRATVKLSTIAVLTAAATLVLVTSAGAAQAGRPSATALAVNVGLIEATRRGDLGAMRELLDTGADVNATVAGDGSPLIAAATRGDIRAVQLLIERGADVNVEVSGDGNPLIAAARGGHLQVVTLLLDRGAEVNQVVAGDENALIQASGAGHLDVVKLLVVRGADVNARVLAEVYRGGRRLEPEWRTALGMAREGGHTAVVSYLLSIGGAD
jgi:ankyrin repeat protein